MLFQQQFLKANQLGRIRNDIQFADGNARGLDLQVMDKNALPKANRLMAELFGSERNLGLSYRNHQINNVRAAATAKDIRVWFKDVGTQVKADDRLVLYVTAHGSSSSDRKSPPTSNDAGPNWPMS